MTAMGSPPIALECVTEYFGTLGQLPTRVEVTMASRHNDLLQSASFSAGVAAMIAWAHEVRLATGKIIFIGNGGSAAIASHMAADYLKNGGFRAVAYNDPSLLTCLSNDCGYETVFANPIAMFAEPRDLLIAMSSSGRSSNILQGVAAARSKGCGVISLSGFAPDNPLRNLGELNFYVPSHAYGFVEITHLAICHAVLDLSRSVQGG